MVDRATRATRPPHRGVGLLEADDEVRVTSEAGEWLRIKGPAGGAAFVDVSFLTEAAPVVALEPRCTGKARWTGSGRKSPTSPTATFGIIPILVNRNLVRGVFRRYRRWKRDYIGIPMVAFWKASTWTARSKAGGSCASPTGESKNILMVSNGCQVT